MFDVLYPGRMVVLDTGLNLAEVTSRLAREVTPPATPWFRDTRTQLFEGTFANGRFQMIRLVKGRNSFNPMLKGELSQTATGTRIHIQMQLHLLALAVGFVISNLAGMFASFAAYRVPVIARVPFVVQLLVIGLFALVFAALGTMEARKATSMLERLLDAREESWVVRSLQQL